MNKYTKNQIFFNLEKIIALSTVTTIIILTISLLSSCATTMTSTYKPNYDYLKSHKNQYTWQCPTYK